VSRPETIQYHELPNVITLYYHNTTIKKIGVAELKDGGERYYVTRNDDRTDCWEYKNRKWQII
jgi:K+/H+ antiporter YhaU regulatory subunit KhtT